MGNWMHTGGVFAGKEKEKKTGEKFNVDDSNPGVRDHMNSSK